MLCNAESKRPIPVHPTYDFSKLLFLKETTESRLLEAKYSWKYCIDKDYFGNKT